MTGVRGSPLDAACQNQIRRLIRRQGKCCCVYNQRFELDSVTKCEIEREPLLKELDSNVSIEGDWKCSV